MKLWTNPWFMAACAVIWAVLAMAAAGYFYPALVLWFAAGPYLLARLFRPVSRGPVWRPMGRLPPPDPPPAEHPPSTAGGTKSWPAPEPFWRLPQ